MSLRFIAWTTAILAAGPLNGCRLNDPDGTPGRLPPEKRPGESTRILRDEPAWSPDGSKIAYVRHTQDDEELSVGGRYVTWVADLTTGAGVRVGQLRKPVWSPDGTDLLLYVDGAWWALRVSDGTRRFLARSSPGVHARWSPTGERLLYRRSHPGLPATWMLVAVDDSEVRDTGIQGTTADWSPDGEWVWVTSGGESELGRFRIPDPPATYEVILRIGPARIRDPRLHPDGSRIAYTGMGEPGAAPVAVVIWTVGEIERRVVAPWGSEPSWSPDGSRLVYTHYDGENDVFDVWILDLETGERYPLFASPDADSPGEGVSTR